MTELPELLPALRQSGLTGLQLRLQLLTLQNTHTQTHTHTEFESA